MLHIGKIIVKGTQQSLKKYLTRHVCKLWNILFQEISSSM